MKEIACIGCKHHQINKNWHEGILALLLIHSCGKNNYKWKPFRFQAEAPEKCSWREPHQ